MPSRSPGPDIFGGDEAVVLFVGINAVFETVVSFLVSTALCRVVYPVVHRGSAAIEA